jgi:DNA-directed RNA polymerase subunit RPC12/RpoP
MKNQETGKTGDVLFKCPGCSKNLCVGASSIGRSFVCPDCNSRVVAPKPEFSFACPKCAVELQVAHSARASFFFCPSCDQKIAVPLKDPKAETQPIAQDPQQKPREKRVTAFVRRGMAPGDKIPLPVLNKESDLKKKYEERIVQSIHAFQENMNRKSRVPLMKASKVLGGILSVWLFYFSLAKLFHPYVAAGLTIIVLMITVPLFFKAKWVFGD